MIRPRTFFSRSFSACVLVCTAFFTQAQSEEDALRLSTIQPGGTARSIGIANAFGALGADAGSIGINPGGMGLYRTSEISITPSFEVNSVKSSYEGALSSDSKSRLFFNNIALVFNSPSKSGGDWRSTTFGVVYDRKATHHWSRQAEGTNVRFSILDGFASDAYGYYTNELLDNLPYTSGLAYQAWGIDPRYPSDTLNTEYFATLPDGALVSQVHTIETRGSTNNTSFFFSGNYMDRLYIGASMGIVGFRYNSTTTHTETTMDEAVNLKDLTWKENLLTTGNGLEVKIGAVGRISDRFRAGIAFHSPMFTQLNDVYNTELRTNFTVAPDSLNRSFDEQSIDGIFNYRVHSPWRAVFSAAFLAGTHGLLSLDYEYTDYSNARFRASNKLVDPYDFAAENRVIKAAFRAVHSVRVGTEWRAGKWYVRAGFGIVPNAYTNGEVRQAAAMQTYAGGFGYRSEHLSLDLGVNVINNGYKYYQYDPSFASLTTEDRSTVRSLVTVAFRP